MDHQALSVRLAVTFTQYFVGVGYLLWLLGRFGAVLNALPLFEAMLLLIFGGLGCCFIILGLRRCLVSFEARRTAQAAR